MGSRPRAVRRIALALVLALGLAAAPPARGQAPTPPPPAPAGSPATQPVGPGATAPAAGQPLRLTLAEATALALRQQPTIRSAQQSGFAADARIPQARSAFYPRLDVVTSANRNQVFSTVQNRAIRGNDIAIELQARQLVYDFGKTAALVDEARAGARVAGSELERVQDVVVESVRTAYFGLLQAQRLVAVADATVARSELNLRSARGFFDVGTRPRSDVTQAEVEVANARVLVIRARNNVRLARATLANTVGLEATVPIEVEDVLTYEPVALDSAQLLTEALANRPELTQAQARLDAARAQLSGARAGYWPDISLIGAYGGSGDEELNEAWSIGAALSWNLFQGFATQSRVRETEALLETARANVDTLELQVRLEVEQAYLTVVESAERIAATAKAVESAQENLRLAQGRYDAGVGTILELTDAQLSLSNAEADHVTALTDYRVGLATLDRVVGRP
jgi:TolC family type I secretion outer membrane protein